MTEDEETAAKQAETNLLQQAMVDNDADLIHAVAEAFRVNRETRRRQDKIIIALGVLFGLVALMATVSFVSVITLREVQKISKTVEDCVDLEGECYAAARKQRQINADRITATVVAAAACARDPRVDDVGECVNERIADLGPVP